MNTTQKPEHGSVRSHTKTAAAVIALIWRCPRCRFSTNFYCVCSIWARFACVCVFECVWMTRDCAMAAEQQSKRTVSSKRPILTCLCMAMLAMISVVRPVAASHRLTIGAVLSDASHVQHLKTSVEVLEWISHLAAKLHLIVWLVAVGFQRRPAAGRPRAAGCQRVRVARRQPDQHGSQDVQRADRRAPRPRRRRVASWPGAAGDLVVHAGHRVVHGRFLSHPRRQYQFPRRRFLRQGHTNTPHYHITRYLN